MGEIKSTLDLVLEKTSHLTLSEEEKRQQKEKEARGRLTGLLQRYVEGVLDIAKMGEELDRLVQPGDGLDESTVRGEIARRVALGTENGPWLALLQARYRFDPTGVRSVESEFRNAIEAAAGSRKEEIGKELQQHHRISGSAVVPNLDADPVWKNTLQSIAAGLDDTLSAALEKLDKPVD